MSNRPNDRGGVYRIVGFWAGGGLVGAVIGAIVGWATYRPDPNEFGSRGLAIFAGAFIGLLIGALVSPVVALAWLAARRLRRFRR